MSSAARVVASALRARAEGRHEEAMSELLAAAESCRAEGKLGQLALALSGLALTYRELGQPESAWQSVFEDALSAYHLYQDAADARADIGMRLGIAAGWLGLHHDAIGLLISSLELLTSSSPSPGHESRVGQIRGLLVYALRDGGRIEEAVESAESAAASRRKTQPDSMMLVGDLACLSSCYKAAANWIARRQRLRKR